MAPRYTDDELPTLSNGRHTAGRAGDIEEQPWTDDDHPDGTTPTPVWLRDSQQSHNFGWLPLQLQKAGRTIVRWAEGPVPPVQLKIRGWFPTIQEYPLKLRDRFCPKRRHKVFLLLLFYATWFLVWSLMLSRQSGAGYIKGYGQPTNLWCGASFWDKNNGCGLNGNGCRPFSASHLAFRCPANCMQTHLLETYVVGNHSLRYEGLVIGGPEADDPDSLPVYRADSFICQAAIHAGVISDADGGCGVASLIGEHGNYQSTKRHGIKSTPFPSTFPRSYTFQRLSESQAQCPADSRWGLLAVTAVALVLLALFTTSPAVFFFSTFFILFLQVGLVSDPPNRANFRELLSTMAERLLPASFVAFIFYRVAAIPLLTGIRAQIEKTVLYLGLCFIGALNNYTFAVLIPIERLTPRDLRQPGAAQALAIIVTIVVAIIAGQVHYIRISGNMPKYLAIYGILGLSLIILLVLPGERLRIHHYILAMVFVPGTFTQTRACLAYQGLLLGLFINGIARWGFDSIIQTPAALGEPSGGQSRTWWGSQAPNITAEVSPDRKHITFNWDHLPTDDGVDGVSILINDVERWRGYTDEELYWTQDQVTLARRKREYDEPEFYRFAWMNGGSTGRYSKVGIWDEDGMWHNITARDPRHESVATAGSVGTAGRLDQGTALDVFVDDVPQS